MKFSVHSLIRMIVALTLGANVLAIGVARCLPPERLSRTLGDVRFAGLDSFDANDSKVTSDAPLFLDRESGRVTQLEMPANEQIDHASFSPWRDLKGQSQVVGRWVSLRGDAGSRTLSDMGIARLSYPSGDRVTTDVLPVSHPCWFPGTQARIVFAAGDGALYRYTFPERGTASARDEQTSQPTAMAWEARTSEGKPIGQGFLCDLSWPTDSRLEGRLLIAMRRRVLSAGNMMHSPGQIWWLMLDSTGSTIVSAGRLTSRDRYRNDLDDIEEASPVIGTDANGRLILAYLTKSHGQKGWSIELADLEVDKQTLTPRILEKSKRALLRDCYHASPVFAIDGTWLACMTGRTVEKPEIQRLPLKPASAEQAFDSAKLRP